MGFAQIQALQLMPVGQLWDTLSLNPFKDFLTETSSFELCSCTANVCFGWPKAGLLVVYLAVYLGWWDLHLALSRPWQVRS